MEKFLRETKYIILGYIILIVAVLYAYIGIFDNYFYCDDFEYLNYSIDVYYSPDKFFLSPFVIFQSFSFVTYLISLSIFGTNPVGYQLTNLLIHIANILLVGVFVSILFNSKILGLLTSLFWGLSDKYSEVVLEIFERGRTICLFFCLLTLIFILKYFKNSSNKKYYYISLVTAIFCYFSYCDSLMLLPLLIITILIYERDKIYKNFRIYFLHFIPFMILFLIYLICQLIFKEGHPPYNYYNFGVEFFKSFSANIFNYFGLYYLHLESVIAGILILLVFIAILIFYKVREVKFGIIWIFISMLPTVLIPLQSPRYQYVSIIGFSIILAYYVLEFTKFKRLNIILPSITIIFYLFLCIPGIKQDEQYRDFEGSWYKQVVDEFRKVYSQLPKETNFFFIDATFPNIKSLTDIYVAKNYYNFFTRKQASVYLRYKGINGLIYFKSLISFYTFKKEDMIFQELPLILNNKQRSKILLYKKHKFVYMVGNIEEIFNSLPFKRYMFYGRISPRKTVNIW